MDLAGLIGIFLMGFFLCVFVAIVSLMGLDFTYLFLKVLRLKKRPKGYSALEKLIESNQYKRHKKKWGKIYLSNALVYAAFYVLFAIITQNILAGFFIGLIAAVIGFGIAGNKEIKQRQIIQKEVNDSNTNNR